ncbi:MAG: hypothetical protein COA32_00205 [Fluviicola sp.]|nr:MAG: hypothetical protein COA32_00205 [Fluviicola sp.]
MKKKLLSFLSIVMMSSGFVVNAQYCEGGPSSTADSNIEGITLNGVNATSISYTGCPGVLGVEDQTATTVDLVIGQEYTVDVTFGTCGFDYDGAGEVWIDYNQDQVFDAVESIGQSSGTPGTAPWDAPVTFTFTIPQTATVGNTRVRFVQEEGGTNPLDPCANFAFGSVVDFTVNVIAQPATPPTPDQDPAAPSCATGSDLTLAGTPPAGIEWYWQGTDEFGTSTADDGTAPYTVFTNGTYYARAYDPALDAWSEASSITVSNFVLPSDPPAPVPDEDPSCELTGGTNLTVAAAPIGIEYYWQGTNMSGTSQADPATAPYPATTSGTYYVAAYDPATQCWSNTSSVTVSMSNSVPLEPTVINDNISACSGDASILLEATATPSSSYTYTISGDDSFGDGWNGASVEIFVDGTSAIVFDVAATTNSETFAVLEGSTITSVWTSGSFDGECSYEILDENSNVVATSSGGSEITPYMAPLASYDFNWYDAASGGNLLGSGNTLEAVGTSVMPSATTGTYEFYVEQSNGCVSNRVLVTVIVSSVDVDLLAIDESCTDYQDGEIVIDNVNCGVAPFQFSIDGGSSFSNDLTGLSAGTYNVIVQDDNGDQSPTYTVEVDTMGTVIPGSPQYIQEEFPACTGDASVEVEVLGPATADSLPTTSAGGNGCGSGNMFDLTTNTNEVTVTDITVYPNATSSQNVTVYIKTTGGYAGSENAPGDWTLIGSYPINGTAGAPTMVDIDDFVIPNGTTYGVYVEYDAQYTNEPVGTLYSSPDLTLTVGAGHCSSFSGGIAGRAFNGTIHYVAAASTVVEWFDTSTATNSQGTGNPFETVGTGVMPSAVNGTYDFYAYSYLNGCYSDTGTLVQVVVSPLNVIIEGLETTCNGSATGSFVVTDTLCGATPFSYSVDGGAFGSIPTDLLPGQYSVIVEDDNGDQSVSYNFTVTDVPGPQDVMVNYTTDQGGEVGWNPGASETQWIVEWGAPGFTPGTGAEIGSTSVSDTFAIITGLMSNTEYDVYVSADCGSGTTNEWGSTSFITDCSVTLAPMIENFDNPSTWVSGTGFGNTGDTLSRCWDRNPGTGDFFWGVRTGTTGSGSTGPSSDVSGSGNYLFTEGSNGSTGDSAYVYSERVDLSTVTDPYLTFSYHMYGEDIDSLTVYASNDNGSTWNTIGNIYGEQQTANADAWLDTSLSLSAYANDIVSIAFLNTKGADFNSDLAIDEFSILPCIGDAGTDGSEDVCRLDTLVNLNDVITINQTLGGRWEFPLDQGLVVDDTMLYVLLLPTDSYQAYYIVPGACEEDTAFATINVFPPSSAGQNGSLNVCQNEPVNLFDGLNGNVDLGGTWYDPSDNPIAGSQPVASSIPGSFNFDYITSNGVCPADTALVEVIVAPDCDYLSLGEEKLNELTVFPNPATDVINIANPSNSESLRVEILDMNGRVVLTDAKALANATEGSIDVSQLVKGMYTLRVYNEEGQKTFKVVIQ